MASKKLQIVGGFNIPQADFNQTDETKSDFIKNKPDALPNPNALTFTGATTDTYDGSEAKTINIPTKEELVDAVLAAIPEWNVSENTVTKGE